MDLSGALSHIKRIRHQLGVPLTLGSKDYRLRGYCANRLAESAHHEPQMTGVIERALAGRTGAFVDVGTNVGQTLTKVLAIDPSRRYVGFEPQIACSFFLEQFIRDNHLTNASVLSLALSDENRVLPLFSSTAYDEMASIEGALDSTGARRDSVVFVPARVGDEVLEEMCLSEIAVIKVDVEGAELAVLTGLKRTLIQHGPVLIFEVLPNFYGEQRVMVDALLAAKNREKAAALFAYLTALGYEISQIDDAGNIERIDRFDLDDRSAYVSSNFVAFAG